MSLPLGIKRHHLAAMFCHSETVGLIKWWKNLLKTQLQQKLGWCIGAVSSGFLYILCDVLLIARIQESKGRNRRSWWSSSTVFASIPTFFGSADLEVLVSKGGIYLPRDRYINHWPGSGPSPCGSTGRWRRVCLEYRRFLRMSLGTIMPCDSSQWKTSTTQFRQDYQCPGKQGLGYLTRERTMGSWDAC